MIPTISRVPREGVWISTQGCVLMCNGHPVLDLDHPNDHPIKTALSGHYLDVFIHGSVDNGIYGVIIDLDIVGVEDEAAVRVDIDCTEQQRVAIPSRKVVVGLIA